MVFHIFGALAEFERDLIRERTQAGLAAARARGRHGGRPRVEALNRPQKVSLAQALHRGKSHSIDNIR
jgi:DNA invertase Pin-like site-specific DNA recombinase